MRTIFWCLLIFVFTSSDVAACSCDDEDFSDIKNKMNNIFIGTLASRRTFIPFANNKFVFKNIKSYKGRNVDELEVWSGKYSVSCGAKFEYDIPYLVLAAEREGKLWTDSCSSWPMTEEYKPLTDKVLEEVRKSGKAEINRNG